MTVLSVQKHVTMLKRGVWYIESASIIVIGRVFQSIERLLTSGVQRGAVEMNRRKWRLANVRVLDSIQVQLGDVSRRHSVWNVKISPKNIILMQSVVSVRVKDTKKIENAGSLTI